MAIEIRLQFPSDGSLVSERNKYTSLYDTSGRSIIGNKQFTSTTGSLIVYDTTGTEWDNQGDSGLLGLLFYGDRDDIGYSKPIMQLYNFDIDAYNSLALSERSDLAITSNVQAISDTQIDSPSKVEFEGLSIVNPVTYENITVDAGSTINVDGSVDLVDDGGNEKLEFGNCNFKPSTEYTLFVSVESSDMTAGQLRISSASGILSAGYEVWDFADNLGLAKTTFTTDATISVNSLYLNTGQGAIISEMVTITGDGNGKPLVYAIEGDVAIEDAPQFFEGIKDYDEVITSSDKNLFNGLLEEGQYDASTGLKLSATGKVRSNGFIRINGANDIIMPVKVSDVYLYYDVNFNYISFVSELTLSPPTNASYMTFYYTDATVDLDAEIQVEFGVVATDYKKYKSTSIRAKGASVPKITDTESLKSVESGYILKSSDISAFSSGPVNVDYVTIDVPSNFKYNGINDASVYESMLVGSYPEYEGIDFDNSDSNNMFTNRLSTNPIVVLISEKGTYASLAEAQADLAGMKINYQLATLIQRTDSLVLPVYTDGIVSMAYRPTSLYLIAKADNKSGQGDALVEAVGNLVNNLPDIRRNVLLYSDNWVDDTSNTDPDFAFWYYEVKMNCTVDDVPEYNLSYTEKFKATTFNNIIASFTNFVRIYSFSQPSEDIKLDNIKVVK